MILKFSILFKYIFVYILNNSASTSLPLGRDNSQTRRKTDLPHLRGPEVRTDVSHDLQEFLFSERASDAANREIPDSRSLLGLRTRLL